MNKEYRSKMLLSPSFERRSENSHVISWLARAFGIWSLSRSVGTWFFLNNGPGSCFQFIGHSQIMVPKALFNNSIEKKARSILFLINCPDSFIQQLDICKKSKKGYTRWYKNTTLTIWIPFSFNDSPHPLIARKWCLVNGQIISCVLWRSQFF